MRLIPIPPEEARVAVPYWQPFALRAAEFAHVPAENFVDPVMAGSAVAFLVWNGERVIAAFGVEKNGDSAGVPWLGGETPDEWFDFVMEELHEHMRGMGCKRSRIMARPGFGKMLKTVGYRNCAVVVERAL